jgi:hypothetical protein
MVKAHLLPIALVAVFILAAFAGAAFGQVKLYHIEHEWAKVWINQNGTIDLFYNIGFTADSGSFTWVEIGQPKRDFTIGTAFDQYGHTLTTSDVSSSTDFKVRVYFSSSLPAGQTISFNLTTNVAHMIYEDTKNPGNVGMQFIPTWWPQARVNDLRVLVVMPQGVNVSMVKTLESAFWNNTSFEPDGRLAVFWEKRNLLENEQFPVGVSFPKQYVQKYETQPTGMVASLQQYGPPILAFGVSIAFIGTVVYVVRKKPYLMPTISMETLGIRHGLTAVEASYLLEMKPTMIVTEILYSLLHKRAVWVESADPSLKLKIMPQFKDKTETPETKLQYFEIDFLKAIKEDGTLDEEKLAQTVVSLRDTVEEKMRGYCRRDTIDYYRKIVGKAWEQVEQAGTRELASKAYDEHLLWLFLDPNYKSRTEAAFRDRPFEPSPFWLWYWYGYQHYNPKPTYKPNVEMPTQAAKPPTIPGADFANNIATAVEKTSNNIVANIEKFANAIVPAPAVAKASTEPAHHASSCVCACAACACACACVSCACACAGGGAG